MKICLLFALLVAMLLAGCAGPAQDTSQDSGRPDKTEVKMSGKNILMVIAPEGFRDEEYLDPRTLFEAAGANVTVASKGVSVAKGKLGATVKVDLDIADANPADYDAVVFVGGPGATVYFNDSTAHRIANDFYSAGKVTAAICIGPSILANAGVLRSHNATAFESEAANIAAKSKGYTGDSVTVDRNVVTANGPEAAKDFGKAVLHALE